MYVAGLRFEHEERTISDETGGDPIVFQRDFLQMRAADAPQPQPGITHSQLTYLHGWQQTVTATEDQEIRERALGGIDTSVRVRRMARVEIRGVENDEDCTEAWEEVRQQIETETGGVFDESAHELLSSARLRVTFVPGAALDPCAPCAPDDVGRYLGADNQTIHIMLAAPDRYVWGFDNASPLYRVELGEAEDGLVPVRMITEPRDEARWPLVNTVVEFLPWAALLDNNEKVAAETGVFLRVAEGFDPDESSFRIAEADLAQLDALVRHGMPRIRISHRCRTTPIPTAVTSTCESGIAWTRRTMTFCSTLRPVRIITSCCGVRVSCRNSPATGRRAISGR